MEVGSALKFVPFGSAVDPSFWHKLCQLKLEVDKLEERERDVWGFYLLPNVSSLHVDCSSFNRSCSDKLNSSEFTSVKHLCCTESNFSSPLLKMQGKLINLNSSEAFKQFDKNSLLEKVGTEIKNEITNKNALRNPELLNRFILLTFADLKSYDFIYWFAFPASTSIGAKVLEKPIKLNEAFTEKQITSLLKSHGELPQTQSTVFGVLEEEEDLKCIELEKYVSLRNEGIENKLHLCFLDPSSEDEYPGWPLRNILGLVAHCSSSVLPLRILCLRIGEVFKKSFSFTVQLEDNKIDDSRWVGWEKNRRGKYGPRSVNLRNDMDPVKLAETSADLNLKLMKWRLVPDLNLDEIQNQKCLLLGAGTLGCSVARCLMAWGIRHITFVDNSEVSFSNPVRQSLYNHEDCDLGNKTKAKAEIAATAVKKILPTIVSSGVVLDIPMPGHSTSSMQSATELHDLVQSHSVVFLLTDSRESRWLPTLLATSLNKIAITAALGFDTYLVMRHGTEDDSGSKLGCYFCNDVTAPGNSKVDRTLDQQCTVTRPGISSIAAALAVELMVSLLQNPLGSKAKPTDESILGNLPHSIRGFLSTFSQVMPATPAFSQCVACSKTVVDSYNDNREDFLKNVFESSSYLETLTGLTELHKNTADTLEMWELSEDSD